MKAQRKTPVRNDRPDILQANSRNSDRATFPPGRILYAVGTLAAFVSFATLPQFAGHFLDQLRAESGLEYQTRGNRKEGVLPRPVSGYDLELISVLAEHDRQPESDARQFRLRFYLPEAAPVAIVVREINYRKYYWMDGIRPERPWRAGFQNEFASPVADVIRPLGLKLPELGALVRLKADSAALAGPAETVAPAVLYTRKAPKSITGYRFGLVTGQDARIRGFAIYRPPAREPVFKGPGRLTRGGRSFILRWPAQDAAAGKYRLLVNGYAKSNNARLRTSVDFYHQPNLDP